MNNAAMLSPAGVLERAESVLESLSLREKVGQLVQVNGDGHVSDSLRDAIARGEIGSVINEVDPATVTELQRLARSESPNGIPLLIGRDVIHGFRTIFPIPLGLAATFDEALVEEASALSAREAAIQGINWTFAPMLDVSRDPRWGRIAESLGEDTYLTTVLGSAMVRGFQRDSDHRLLACPKHFVGYGASESGRDYNTASIPELELRNVYLPPFKAALDSGAASLMPSFSDLNGRPPTGNRWLLRDVLREEWGFDGFVVSDWASVTELAVHGLAADDADAARIAVESGTNMDMASGAYAHHLERLVEEGIVAMSLVDELVLEVLKVKISLGLFDEKRTWNEVATVSEESLALAQRAAEQSIVLLKNDDAILPLAREQRVALIGPLADQPYEQLGTWVFDADMNDSISLRAALEARIGNHLGFSAGLETSRDRRHDEFEEALELARSSDVVILALGEESILSGEAHCRTDISLPGAQEALVAALADVGKPIVGVVMAGRPLVLESVTDHLDAMLFAWHPGTMAGPALVNLLYGDVNPSGKLPVTLPRSVGQIPIFYNHRNTGRPPVPESINYIDDIDPQAHQVSVGNTSFHLDVHPSPAYPFGFGLSYTSFDYSDLEVLSASRIGDGFSIAVSVTNLGERPGCEVLQLYIQDPVASATRPVRELKRFRRLSLEPGETRRVELSVGADDLAFFNGEETIVEPGVFRVWVGGDANAPLGTEFELVA